MIFDVIKINLAYGLLATPILFEYGTVAGYNSIFTGIIFLMLAVFALFKVSKFLFNFSYILAFWLLLAPFILKYESDMAIVNGLFFATAIIILNVIKNLQCYSSNRNNVN